jgi:hypothetical protein
MTSLEPSATTGSSPRVFLKRPTTARVPIWFGAIFAIFGLGFMSIGWGLGITQQYRLATYEPVSARVLSSHVSSHTSHGRHGTSTTYSPVVNYVYSVKGAEYQSSRATVINVSSSGNWAWNIVARYPKGALTTAWYSPSDPSSAFLVHEADSFPYIFALFPAIFVAAGVWMVILSLHGGRPVAAVIAVGDGWFGVPEDGTLRGRFWINAFAAVCLYGYAGIVIGDYSYLSRKFDVFFFVASAAAGVAGLVFITPMWRYWRLWHDFLDADLRVSAEQIRPGSKVQLTLRQELVQPLEIERLSLGLVCIRDDRIRQGRGVNYTSIEDWSEWKDLAVNRSYQASGQVEVQGSFAVPAEANPSSEYRSRDYPQYRWYFELGLVADGEPQLSVYFPVRVEG